MLVPFRKLSMLAGLSTALLIGGMILSSSASASTATPAAHQAPAAAAASEVLSVPAAHATITLTAAHGEATTMRVVTGAPLATQVVPRGIKCYFPTCGWEFSHAQTVALHAAGVATAIATCLRFLPGHTTLCAAVGAWLGAHVAPGAHQCLYVSTLPVGVIKYVSC
jgi:hypothetical protein